MHEGRSFGGKREMKREREKRKKGKIIYPMFMINRLLLDANRTFVEKIIILCHFLTVLL